MSPQTIFQIQLALGYVAWLLCFGTYIMPRPRAMDRIEAHRAIATFVISHVAAFYLLARPQSKALLMIAREATA